MAEVAPTGGGIFVWRDFFTPEECDAHISQAEFMGFEPAPPMAREDQHRNNERIKFSNHSLSTDLLTRLGGMTPVELSSVDEQFRYYRYNVGHYISAHGDQRLQRGDESRLYSFVVYLNEGFTGGITRFHTNAEPIDVVPMTGQLLIFENPLRHESTPVLSGTKYVFRGDLWVKSPLAIAA